VQRQLVAWRVVAYKASVEAEDWEWPAYYTSGIDL